MKPAHSFLDITDDARMAEALNKTYDGDLEAVSDYPICYYQQCNGKVTKNDTFYRVPNISTIFLRFLGGYGNWMHGRTSSTSWICNQ